LSRSEKHPFNPILTAQQKSTLKLIKKRNFVHALVFKVSSRERVRAAKKNFVHKVTSQLLTPQLISFFPLSRSRSHAFHFGPIEPDTFSFSRYRKFIRREKAQNRGKPDREWTTTAMDSESGQKEKEEKKKKKKKKGEDVRKKKR
jgi:hypothetical protein